MVALVRFDARAGWGETLVCDDKVRAGLAPHGIAWGAAPYGTRPTARGEAPSRQTLYRFRGNALLYVAESQGWVGLLCEPGEWAVLPPDLPHKLDCGSRPASRVLRAGSSMPEAAVLSATAHDAGLPTLDAFIDHLLLLQGQEAGA